MKRGVFERRNSEFLGTSGRGVSQTGGGARELQGWLAEMSGGWGQGRSFWEPREGEFGVLAEVLRKAQVLELLAGRWVRDQADAVVRKQVWVLENNLAL